jgi:hypothetical protein
MMFNPPAESNLDTHRGRWVGKADLTLLAMKVFSALAWASCPELSVWSDESMRDPLTDPLLIPVPVRDGHKILGPVEIHVYRGEGSFGVVYN